MIESKLVDVPVRVRWRGWESDTYTLRNQGWKIFAHEEMRDYKCEMAIRLAVRDPDSRFVIIGELNINPGRFYSRDFSLLEQICKIGMEMQGFQSTDRCMLYEQPKVAWAAMDAMLPTDGFASVNIGQEQRDFKELKLFKYKEDAKELIIPQASVDECLNTILRLQFPEQQRIKMSAETNTIIKPAIQAKIYALAA